MLFQVSALLPLLALASSAAVPSNLPVFCHGLDCPQFTVLHNTTDYELRRYGSTKWASVEAEAATRDDVNHDLFYTLFHYIDGQNAQHIKIPMTAPVLMTVTHGQGPNCASNFSMHFMLPHTLWSSPIAPTDPRVHIVTLPPMDVYVKSFGGWAKDDNFKKNVAALYQSLSSETPAPSVETSFFYSAGYNGPYEFANRHNEVWIQKV